MATNMLSARVPPDVRDAAVVRATFDGITLSDAVRQLLVLYGSSPDGGPLRTWLLERQAAQLEAEISELNAVVSRQFAALAEVRKENESLRTSLLAMVREEMEEMADVA